MCKRNLHIEAKYNDTNEQRANVTSSKKLYIQYKIECIWSLRMLHNTVGGVMWAGETRAGCLVSFQ